MKPTLDFLMTRLDDRVFRVCVSPSGATRRQEGALRRYSVLPELPGSVSSSSTDLETPAASIRMVDVSGSGTGNDGALELSGADGVPRFRQIRTALGRDGSGFSMTIALDPGERIYGLGDVTRDRLDKRGFATQMWVRNVASYVPIPIILSTAGWALYLETTFRHFVDVDSKGNGELTIWSHGGDLTYLLAVGDSLKSLLEAMTGVVGRPTVLPLWAYGFTFVCNQQADAKEMIDDCMRFRDRGIPCDVVGLEPGWMSKNYDYTTEKAWHPERFYIPYWSTKGPHTFLGAAGRLGFKMSLWLCCDYDLGEIEEARALEREASAPTAAGEKVGDFEAAIRSVEEDLLGTENFGHAPIRLDHLTKRGVGWFDHLKQFVDQGVRAFKLDGANQVNEHPDRGWANGMSDEEMHNLYPALLNKQMSQGFETHTGLRSMIYSSGGYAGIPRFSATWAGDTGGGTGPLVSMLNHGLSGHSNTSCDMDVFSKIGIHFGFLMPWSQLCSWAYWRHPWLLGDEMETIFRDYARLRYRLLPYLYSAAHTANRTGIPMMRAMHLEFPDDPRSAERLSQYLLGDSFLVGTFDSKLYLPEVDGGWIDFWSGKRHEGGVEIECTLPSNRGGALFVRAGSIIPAWSERDYVGQKPSDPVELWVYSGGSGSTTLYEDDGESLEYRNGCVAVTRFERADTPRGGEVVIGKRVGAYPGMSGSRSFRVIVDPVDGRFEGSAPPIDVAPLPDREERVAIPRPS
jgi:alpha-glucosidase